MKLKKYPELTIDDITQAVSQYEKTSAESRPVFFDNADAVYTTFHALNSWSDPQYGNIYAELRERVLAVVFSELPSLLKIFYDIGKIAQFLTETECRLFEEQLTTDVCHNLFTQLSDLHAAHYATDQASRHVLKQVFSKMVDLITCQQHFIEVLSQSTNSEITDLCDALATKGKLQAVVGDNFAAVIQAHNSQISRYSCDASAPHYRKLAIVPSKLVLVEAYLQKAPVPGCSNSSASQEVPAVNTPLRRLPGNILNHSK